MKYYIYIQDNDQRIECSKHIFQLNEGDHIHLNGVIYEVDDKSIDYDDELIDINVHIDE